MESKINPLPSEQHKKHKSMPSEGKINNKIKEIERFKELEKEKKIKIGKWDFSKYEDCRRFKELNEELESFRSIESMESELKLLKQFQKEIKEIQGELKERIKDFDHLFINSGDPTKELLSNVDKIFKKHLGEIK